MLRDQDVLNSLITFYNGSRYNVVNLFDIHDESPTTSFAFFNVMDHGVTLQARAKCIFLRNLGWYINEIDIFDNNGNPAFWWKNTFIRI